jgi:hypothetical protein
LNGILPGNSISLRIRVPKEINLRARPYAILEIEAHDMADFFDEDHMDGRDGGGGRRIRKGKKNSLYIIRK